MSRRDEDVASTSSCDSLEEETVLPSPSAFTSSSPLLSETTANVYTVCSSVDDGSEQTLRSVLAQAATNTPALVEFDVPEGVVTLERRIDLTAGAGGIMIDGFNDERGIEIRGSAADGTALSTNGLVSVTVADGGEPVCFSNLTFRLSDVPLEMTVTNIVSETTNVVTVSAYGSAVTVRGGARFYNCRFADNASRAGAAVTVESGRPVFQNCCFVDNRAQGEDGGAVLVTGGHPVFAFCTFTGNKAAGAGGGLAVTNDDVTATCAACTFFRNAAGNGGRAVAVRSGAAAKIGGSLLYGDEDDGEVSADAGATLMMRFCALAKEPTVDGTMDVLRGVKNYMCYTAEDLSLDYAVSDEARETTVATVTQTWVAVRTATAMGLLTAIRRSPDWTSVGIVGCDLDQETELNYVALDEAMPETLSYVDISVDQLGEMGSVVTLGARRAEGVLRFTFDADGGTVYPSEAEWMTDEPVPDAPIPQKDGVAFAGWYVYVNDVDEEGGEWNHKRLYFDDVGVSTLERGYHSCDMTVKALWLDAATVFNVTSDADGSALTEEPTKMTLRDAFHYAAAHPELVRPDDGSRVIRIHAENRDFAFSEALEVRGSSADTLTLDGGGEGITLKMLGCPMTSMLNVSGMSVSFRNLTFTGGGAGVGGAVRVTDGAVSASNCAFRACKATFGGAVAAEGSTVAFTNCTFDANTAGCVGGVALDASSRADFANCTFRANDATNTADYASALGLAPGAKAHLANCTFAEHADAHDAYGTSNENCLFLDRPEARTECTAFGTATNVAVGGVLHTWYVPLACSNVVGDLASAPLAFDQTGRPEALPGRGAVRNGYWGRLRTDPASGRYTGPTEELLACGSVIPERPVPMSDFGVFQGWQGDWSQDPSDWTTMPLVSPATLVAAWTNSPDVLVVTCGDDAETPQEGYSTLRAAVRALRDDPNLRAYDGTRTITFSLGENAKICLSRPLEFDAKASDIAIDGFNGGYGVELVAAGGAATRLVTVAGDGIALRNLALRGGDAGTGKGGCLLVSDGSLAVSNVAFSAGRAAAGGGVAVTGGRATFDGVSFDGCAATGTAGGSAVQVEGPGSASFVNALFASGKGGAGGFVADGGAVSVRYATFIANENDPEEWGAETDCNLIANTPERQAAWFDPSSLLSTQKVGTVKHVLYVPRTVEATMRADDGPNEPGYDLTGRAPMRPGRGAVRSAWLAHLLFDANGGQWTEPDAAHERDFLLGGSLPDTVPGVRFPGRKFGGWRTDGGVLVFDSAGQAVPGVDMQNGTLYADWTVESSVVVQTEGDTPEDGQMRADGLLTFREALQYLAAHRLDDPDLPRTVTFRDGLAGATLDRALALTDPGDIVLSGEGATLVLNAPLSLSGKGSLSLQNVTVEGDGQRLSEGVNALSLGLSLHAENAAFRNLLPGDNAAGISLAGGRHVFLRCTVAGCATEGLGTSAVCLEPKADAVFAMCTFDANGNGSSRAALTAGSAATLNALECTFAQNVCARSGSGATSGAIATSGATVGLYGCAFAHNGSSSSYADVTCTGGSLKAVSCTWAKATLPAGATQPNCFTQADPGALFVRMTANPVSVDGVVQDCILPVNVKAEGMKDGVIVWHDDGWSNVAWSDSLTADKTAVLGASASATRFVRMDVIGNVTEVPVRGSVAGAMEESLEVTTTKDTIDAGDGFTSLREAIRACVYGFVEPGEDGTFEITFAKSLFDDAGCATLKLDSGTLTVDNPCDIRIQGPTDGRRLTIEVASSVASAFETKHKGAALRFSNASVQFRPGTKKASFATCSKGTNVFSCCTFAGVDQRSGTFIGNSDGAFTHVDRCSFVNSSSVGPLRFEGHGVVSGCTFANVTNLTTEGLVEFRSKKGVAVVANSTFTGTRVKSGSVYIDEKHDRMPVIVNSVLVFSHSDESVNQYVDIFAESSFSVHSCGFTYAYLKQDEWWTLTKIVENCYEGLVPDRTPVRAATFGAPLRSVNVQGTDRWYRPLERDGAAERHGCWVWHDPSWETVFCSTDWVGMDGTFVSGSGGLAWSRTCERLSVDIVGRPIPSVYPSPGSYATMSDSDYLSTRGTLTVGTTDDGEVSSFDDVVSLREAVELASTHPELCEENGDCTIDLAADLAEYGETRIRFARAAIAISAFTDRTLTIRGPSADSPLVLDGDGRHRIFDIRPGNRVRFENILFTNAFAAVAGGIDVHRGGAVYNAGTAVFSNCAFRVCRAGAEAATSATLGWADGGALCTVAGGTSRVEQCTFADCTAARGGAVATMEGGVTRLAAVTLARNAAVGSGAGKGCGGAVFADAGSSTLIVHGTLADNATDGKGGGVASAAGSGDATVSIVDSIILGNASGDGLTDDLSFEAPSAVAYVTAGPSAIADNRIVDFHADTSALVSNVFARTVGGLVPLGTNATAGAVVHDVYPLLDGIAPPAAFVRADATWENVAFGAAKDSITEALCGLPRVARRGAFVSSEITGAANEDVAFAGSSRQTCARDVTPLPPPVNPLEVTTGISETNLAAVLETARTHPELAQRGILTVTFGEGAKTVTFEKGVAIPANAFANVRLKLQGPVTFRPASGCGTRFLDIAAGNDVVLANVTCDAGRGVETGGALHVVDAKLTAQDCAFKGNTAAGGDWGGFGGAVCFEGMSARGTFERCSFEGNAAEADAAGSWPGVGQSIYRDDTHLVLKNCTFVNSTAQAEVELRELHARVEHRDSTEDYYDELAEAVYACNSGDTLVRISANTPKDGFTLQRGVGFRDESGESAQALAPFLTSLAAAIDTGSAYRTAVASAYGVELVLNAEATPVIDSESAFDVVSDPDRVSLRPSNVKPGVRYGLGYSETPVGPFKVDTWVEADAEGRLPAALTAPKPGAGGFYRVMAE